MVTDFRVQLSVQLKYDGRDWIAICQSLEVSTQAKTKTRARKSLVEAVGLWFESCIERKTLDSALEELGFAKIPVGSPVPENTDFVGVSNTPHTARSLPSFTLGKGRLSNHIEGLIPSSIAAEQLGSESRAAV